MFRPAAGVPRPEISRSAMSPRERGLRARAAQILATAGLLHGALVPRLRACGRATCHCAQGEKHPALYVYRQQAGTLRQLYVSKAADADVRAWNANDRELRALLEELWELHWQRAKCRVRGPRPE